MATLMLAADGNWSSSSTWKTVDSTSELDSEAGNSWVTTSYISSSSFTPGAITVEGIAFCCYSSTNSSVTFTSQLYNSTDSSAVAGTEVAVYTSQLPYTGWFFIKWASPVTLTAGKAYVVQAKTSSSSNVALYRDATTTNWSRMLRTSTTAAPSTGDKTMVLGELTGSGTGNTLTATYNITATTDYGPVKISGDGAVVLSTASSTNFVMKVSGDITLYGKGTFTIVPASTSTFELNFDCTSNVEFGLIRRSSAGNAGSWTWTGATKTPWTTLTSNATSGSASLVVSSTTNWAVNDVLGIPSTSRTWTQSETGTIQSIMYGTNITLTGNLTNNHQGSDPVYGEVGNLTRNIKIHGASSSYQAYIYDNATDATSEFSYVEFYYMGSNTANKRGLDFAPTTGSITFTGCAFRDFVVSSSSVYVNSTSGTNITFDTCVFWNIASTNIGFRNATTTGAYTVTGCLFAYSPASTMLDGGAMRIGAIAAFTSNHIVAGAGSGFTFGDTGFANIQVAGTTFQYCVVRGMAQAGATFQAMRDSSIGRITSCRNTSSGIVFIGCHDITATEIDSYGNGTQNLYFQRSANFWFSDLSLNGETSYTSVNGISINSGDFCTNIYIEDSNLGGSVGTLISHTYDINFPSSTKLQIFFRNTTLGSASEVSTTYNSSSGSFVASQKTDASTGWHRAYIRDGKLERDTTIYSTASPSLRITPNNATNRPKSFYGDSNAGGATFGRWEVAVASGNTTTVSVKVRESVSGDGTDYNGQRIRLYVEKNIAAGISTDTLLATATASSEGAFETISGTTASVTDDCVLSFYVDCGGTGYTGGWINVDDFSATAVDTRGFKYWSDGAPDVHGNNVDAGGASGGSYTFIG